MKLLACRCQDVKVSSIGRGQGYVTQFRISHSLKNPVLLSSGLQLETSSGLFWSSFCKSGFVYVTENISETVKGRDLS